MPAFYAGLSDTVRGIPAGRYLISAHRWRGRKWSQPQLPEGSELAVDCGAFSAWSRKLPAVTYEQYTAWLRTLNPRPTWAAAIDVIFDSDATFWNWVNRPIDVAWTWIPTAHGATVEEYVTNALRLVDEADTNLPHFRLGVGGLVPKSLAQTIEVVKAIHTALPDLPLHLWGVGVKKKPALTLAPNISCDTSTWSIMAGRYRPVGMTAKDHKLYRLAWYRDQIERL